MKWGYRHHLLLLLWLLLVSGCASIPSMTDSCKDSLMETFGECVEEAQEILLPTHEELIQLPPAEQMPVVAVYAFTDKTGQRKRRDGIADFSTAVTQGAEVCVIGRGLTVGRPLGLLLTRKEENATITLTHTGTKDLAKHVKQADIVVAAIGKAHFLTAQMIKPGATVLDVGISRTEAGLLGDVHPDVFEVAANVAPMPGGVGPMTRAMLLTNVVEACE